MSGPDTFNPCYTYCYEVVFSTDGTTYCPDYEYYHYTACFCGTGDNDADILASARAQATDWAQGLFDALDHAHGPGWFSTTDPPNPEFGLCGVEGLCTGNTGFGRPGLFETTSVCSETGDVNPHCWCISTGSVCAYFYGTNEQASIYAASIGLGGATRSVVEDGDPCRTVQCWCIEKDGGCDLVWTTGDQVASIAAALGATSWHVQTVFDSGECMDVYRSTGRIALCDRNSPAKFVLNGSRLVICKEKVTSGQCGPSGCNFPCGDLGSTSLGAFLVTSVTITMTSPITVGGTTYSGSYTLIPDPDFGCTMLTYHGGDGHMFFWECNASAGLPFFFAGLITPIPGEGFTICAGVCDPSVATVTLNGYCQPRF